MSTTSVTVACVRTGFRCLSVVQKLKLGIAREQQHLSDDSADG